MSFIPIDPDKSHPERDHKVHPLVNVTYWIRLGGYPLMAMAVLSAMDDPSSLALPMIVIALVWPHVAHLIGRRFLHPRVPFRLLVWDGFLNGAFVACTGLQWTVTGSDVLVVTAWFLMVGGVRLLLQGSLAMALGIGVTTPFFLIGFWAAPAPATVVLCTSWLAFSFFLTSLLVNDTTRRFVSTRRDLRVMNEIARTANATLDFDQVLETAMTVLQSVFPFDQLAIYLLDESREVLVARRVLAPGLDRREADQDLENLSIPIAESDSAFSHAVSNQQPFFLGEISSEVVVAMSSHDRALFERYPMVSLLILPLEVEGETIGVIYFGSTQERLELGRRKIGAIRRYMPLLAMALRNARLYEQVQAAQTEAMAQSAELERKNEQIIKAQNQLVLQEKMASLGQVTAGIAHEIKNPLNFVNNFAEGSVELADDLIKALKKHKDSPKSADFDNLVELIQELRQNAVDIGDNGKRADSIVRNMMDHARGTKGERRVIDLNTVTLENLHLAYHGFRARFPSFNVELRHRFDGTLPVEVIPQDLGRVLLNLLSNACYAVYEKQQVAGDTYSPTITVSTRPEPEAVEIRIRDNGPGIPAEIRDEIFNPFFTTKPTGEGNTGLGLSIAYEIVTQGHHGTIEVESEPGEFAEFVIRLPISGQGN
jgi:signal transduction histidine kinase